jgi:hypothetical protein
MIFLFAAMVILGSFLLIFTLWVVIWSITMSSSDANRALTEDRLSNLP